jgi:cell fate regulator YaaT (PSP1 superfamily)
MTRIVPLKFQEAGRQYDFNALAFELKPGDKVIVETDRGRAMATVVVEPHEVEEEKTPEGLKSILRIATEEDLAMAEANAAREDDAYRYCLERIKVRQMEMKLVRAEYAFDGSKIIFYFTADGRIDFRELVKDLAHHFHTRIEMRQIGVRDEAKLVGGLGICGRELCCCSFLTQFSPVSVKMAKEQGLALNPTKISGQCGRLLCCLGYEFETYAKLKKGLPKCGKKISWQERECEVTNVDILRQQVTLRDREGSCCCITLEELKSGQSEATKPQPAAGEKPARPPAKTQPEGQRPADPDKPVAEKADDAAPDGSKKPNKPDTQDDKSPKKRRRRGRRRPRGGRKPGQNKQGD